MFHLLGGNLFSNRLIPEAGPYQSAGRAFPSFGVQARFHVVPDTPALTPRTLPSPSPTCIAPGCGPWVTYHKHEAEDGLI